MTNREKVIKGLECCIGDGIEDTPGCEDCPYNDMGDTCERIRPMYEDALALLKAQEPDETRLVRHYSRPNVYADLWLHCEKCGGVVDNRYRPTFCPNCGRKVKWK